VEVRVTEYVVKSDWPFEEIEARAMGVLEQHGFMVQRTFSLLSATASGTPGAGRGLGYSVLMVYGSGARGGQTVIHPLFTSPVAADVEAEVVAALTQGGLAFCMDAPDQGPCLDPWEAARDGAAMVRDPVCGKWFSLEQAHASIEVEGVLYPMCCPLCQTEFERSPKRYIRRQAGRAGTS
jgi:YHS domain-containing protein